MLRQHGVDGSEMDTQSCMDRSILAIFEDSSVASEVRVQRVFTVNWSKTVSLGYKLSKRLPFLNLHSGFKFFCC